MSPSSRPDLRQAVLVTGDSVLLLLVLLAAETLAGDAGVARSGPFVLRALLCALVLQAGMFYGELYDYRALRSRTHFFLRLGQSYAAGAPALAFFYYLVPSARVDPTTLLVGLPLSAAAILGWHGLHRWAAGREALSDNVLIVGTGHTARQVAVEMLRREPLGYHVVGFLGTHAAEVGRRLVNPAVVGTVADLLPIVDSLRVNVIVVALEDQRGQLPIEDLLRCRLAGIRVEDAPSFFERLTGKILVSDLRPSWLVFSPGFSKPRLLRSVKRVVEVVVSAALLVAALPLLVALGLLVRLQSRGPALYRQSRVGRRGALFTLLKLRTMRQDAETASGPVWTDPEKDPRVTRLGRLLRKSRLDELPQLWNVLKGEMSFVGPRPERPHFVQTLRLVIPYYDERHAVRPGITGWAQVKFGYGSTIEDSERKLQFDLYYVKNMSLLLDLAIVLETFKVMLLGRGAR
ncbi:MAG TPA: TIGR03013 family XrtA/PEP-CTERM system glycosyltransferase [Vicinamibacteria bacterium]